MPLFEFELLPVEEIAPWGEPGKPSLSWFALSYGIFRMVVGEQTLFRYTPEILAHWGSHDPRQRDVHHEIAEFAREMFDCVAAAIAPLPPFFEALAADWTLLRRLEEFSRRGEKASKDDDRYYTAWRWLGERSPSTSYLIAYPEISFLRVGSEVRLGWDNTRRLVDGITVWTAGSGVLAFSVDAFVAECEDFAERLLKAMESRITDIEAGRCHPQTAVDIASLRQQQETWRALFAAAFYEHEPDLPWDEAEAALRAIAGEMGVAPA
jgi:hypothetical protein